ncbi:MAG: adenylate/guanylate cyclase domain-containing protein [Acidimicrobiia bacterium]|nr:adenylate/guanylate cyclase domain-containing protein [Acidimicrobiia bacterium]
MANAPPTRYTRSGDVNIAYQVVGEGPHDLVYVPGWVSNIEVMWDEPVTAGFLRRLASFSRLITFDKRGTGMSDAIPVDRLPTLEERMDDVRAVMDAVGSESATLMGHSEGGNMCILFAATYPDRADALILIGSYAKRIWSEDYPWAPKPDDREDEITRTEEQWGDATDIVEWIAPSRASDPAFITWMSRYFRLSASPHAAASLLRMNTAIDTTAVLPAIRVPTLCLYKTDDKDVRVEEGAWIASQIPGAKFVELSGADHFFGAGKTEPMLAEIQEFVTGHRSSATPERVLATVLFTDIVGSTQRAAELGDREWRHLLERHNEVIRAELVKYRGREVGTVGDGLLATFDGPARAIGAAHAICAAVRPLGLEVRAGLHTGEIETLGEDVAGLAVHIGARISSLAGAGEVLVSRTVKDLVAGSGITFEDRGVHPLKGVPDEWQVYAAL